MQEALRRRVFVVVLVLSVGFLVLYGLGAKLAFGETNGFADRAAQTGLDSRTIAGATILGLAMFAILFLGTILVVFLTLGAVRGDAERGLLQPLLVRPVSRPALLAARFIGAAVTAGAYVALIFLGALLITRATGDYWPDRVVVPMVQLAAAVAIMAAISLLGSIWLSGTANGIAVFMVFGAGLTAGLLGQIAKALGAETLESISRTLQWALPFEALYQDALSGLTADASGVTEQIVRLGPFGGAQAAGPLLLPYAVLYVVIIGALAAAGFRRRDL
ncbi:MAG TPA: ABC transporter permease subunit [Miltoncostaeaceae bacterium]|nr:ABC transporter permease subunit [Miltoncostaeaceae bacterium]